MQEQFGIDRVMRFMEDHKKFGAEQFAERLVAQLSRWSGQTAEQAQQDDITLLVIDFQRKKPSVDRYTRFALTSRGYDCQTDGHA